MVHRNAPLSETGRLRLARCVVEDGWPLRRAADRFQVSATTAKRWADRYRVEGLAGMADRSSRPYRSPARTAAPLERKVLHLRATRRWGPARIGGRLGLPTSTCHAVLRRAGVARLAHLDRATAQPVRRYEHAAAGDLIHVDIKKLGNIPDGGGWRTQGRRRGKLNRTATPGHDTDRWGGARLGYAFLHTALDDHSRLAYTEILTDETRETATAFWQRAHAWFTANGITVRRVITDNGSCYRSRLWRETLSSAGISVKKTRPYRPQTNGKVERFHRTLTEEWAYARPYLSEAARRRALPGWLHAYNHHRAHTALGGQPPASRVPNLSGQNTWATLGAGTIGRAARRAVPEMSPVWTTSVASAATSPATAAGAPGPSTGGVAAASNAVSRTRSRPTSAAAIRKHEDGHRADHRWFMRTTEDRVVAVGHRVDPARWRSFWTRR
ncbi:transposase IS481 family protein [Micromonospora palomenae]|uniref:Transposase IS481 family protein n=1 Tax=Micromonospora palomenae TaxID=1461247 RepID=A0A561WXK1_9ACTN|nr:transposase IS481 family protein [Micromonospora palomenae]